MDTLFFLRHADWCLQDRNPERRDLYHPYVCPSFWSQVLYRNRSNPPLHGRSARCDLLSETIYLVRDQVHAPLFHVRPIYLFVGEYIDDGTFKFIMGACIFISVLLMIWGTNKAKKSQDAKDFTDNWWYSPSFGLLVGFSTMIGNAAGPALTIYLLTRKLNKVTLVATGAWFIMILNFSKIPLQLFVWKNLTWEGIILNCLAIPFILLGGYIGIKLVKIIPEKEFKIVILALVIISSLMLMFG